MSDLPRAHPGAGCYQGRPHRGGDDQVLAAEKGQGRALGAMAMVFRHQGTALNSSMAHLDGWQCWCRWPWLLHRTVFHRRVPLVSEEEKRKREGRACPTPIKLVHSAAAGCLSLIIVSDSLGGVISRTLHVGLCVLSMSSCSCCDSGVCPYVV